MYEIKDNEITFTWLDGDIIDKVIDYCAIYTANSGEGEFERFSLTVDSIEYFDLMIKKHLDALSSIFVSGSNFKEGSLFNSLEQSIGVGSGFIIYENLDKEGYPLYEKNRLVVLDKDCEEYIVTSILVEWAKANELSKLIKIFEVSKAELLIKLRNGLLHHRIPSYKKSYSYIE